MSRDARASVTAVVRAVSPGRLSELGANILTTVATADEPLSGYQIMNRLGAPSGSVYPALARLVERGLLTGSEHGGHRGATLIFEVPVKIRADLLALLAETQVQKQTARMQPGRRT